MSVSMYYLTPPCLSCGSSSQRGEIICSLTGNLLPMLADAGLPLRSYHGKTAGEFLPSLIASFGVLMSDPKRFEALNPRRWGSYQGLMQGIPRWLAVLADVPPHSRLDVR